MTTNVVLGDCAYPVDTSGTVRALIKEFKRNPVAQDVSFRELVPWVKAGERATHYIHSYPAKLLPQIAHFFLAASEYVSTDETVLDPFGGTGTVALEALLSGRCALYADSNPLARLIAKVKTTKLDLVGSRAALERVVEKYKRSRACTPPDVVNINHWYEPKVIRELCRLKSSIESELDGDIKDLLLLSFSSISRKVSLADPRLSVPVKLKEYEGLKRKKTVGVINGFEEQFFSNLKRHLAFNKYARLGVSAQCVGCDARSLSNENKQKLPDNSVGIIITSPPYAGAQKYIRASSLNLGWLGLVPSKKLRALEDLNIGREHFPKETYKGLILTGIASADSVLEAVYEVNPLRSAIAAIYLLEMRSALAESVRVLRPGGRLVLVIGNNEICGHEFKSSEYLEEICRGLGLDVELKLIDAIKSRGLMTKRNRTASLITREWVLVFRKIQEL